MDGSNTTNDNNPDASMAVTTTVLRIKRRRTEDPIPFIRLEGVRGVGGADAGIGQEEANYRRQQTHSTAATSSSSSSVVWKRVREQQHPSTISDTSPSIRVINAVLGTDESSDQNNEEEEEEYERRSKRRKLTLLDSVTQSTQQQHHQQHQQQPSQNSNKAVKSSSSKGKQQQQIKVLDPLTRMVDDSLQDVLAGTKTIRDHYNMVTTNPVLSSTATTTRKNAASSAMGMMTTIQYWLCWSHSSGGNLLHCCSLWNDDVMARTILSSEAKANTNTTTPYYTSSFVRQITESVDGDGRTPYEVAEMCNHDNVCKVLAEFGGDTSNYIYDVFCHLPLTSDDNNNMSTTATGNTGDDLTGGGRGVDMVDSVNSNFSKTDDVGGESSWMDVMTTAYLTSGVGYWTPDGELILEPDVDRRSRGGRMDNDEYYEDDIDSNCEDYDANDYPDFESGEDDDDDDDENARYNNKAGINNNNNRPAAAAFDPYQGGDSDYEYDWEQDLGAVYGEEEEDRKENYHYYVPDYDEEE